MNVVDVALSLAVLGFCLPLFAGGILISVWVVCMIIEMFKQGGDKK